MSVFNILKSFMIAKVPAKVILTGEHAVVYNKRALAGTIDLFTTVKLEIEEENT